MDILKIKRVQYLDGYRVKLWFSNGDIKIANLSESFDDPIFEPMKNLSYFKNFTIRYNTIEWENGADYAPEYLYEISEPA